MSTTIGADQLEPFTEFQFASLKRRIQRERPWRVAVYVSGSSSPVRIFDQYLTANDANGFADVLKSQAKRNGWNHTIRVEKE